MNISQLVKEEINKVDPTSEVILFGSRARGDNRPDSDWDILILVDNKKVTNEIEDKFRDKLYDIELNSGELISTFIYPKSFWENQLRYSLLYKNITKEGVRLLISAAVKEFLSEIKKLLAQTSSL